MPEQDLRGPGGLTPAQLIAFHRIHFGSACMGPDDPPAGGNNGNQGAGDAGENGGGQNPPADPPADPPAENNGYPENTPIKDMSAEQQAAYWKDKAQKHESTWRGVIDKNLTPDQILGMQKRLADHERAAMGEQERAIQDAREAGRNEAREETFRETATSMLRFGLRYNGITKDDEINEIVAITNFDAFKGEDGVLDEAKIASHVKRQAGTAGGNWPDMGQGRGEQNPVSQKEIGQQEARKRFPDAFPNRSS